MGYRFLILFLVPSLISVGQVPGYMGKRFSIGYSNYFFLAALSPTANSSTSGSELGINTTNCINLEYTIKSRTNFCLSVQKSKTGTDPGNMFVDYYDGYNYYSYNATYSPKPYKPMQINSYNIGLGFKFFNSGSLAPIGKYKKVEILMLLNHLEYNKNAFLIQNSSSTGGAAVYGKFGKGDYNFNTVSVAYTLGRSRVFFDRLVLDGGMRFGFVPAGVLTTLLASEDYEVSSVYTTEAGIRKEFRRDTFTRVFAFQIINIHLGLSFLAF